MKGYFPLDIPTKKYIKAYIHHELGVPPIITTRHRIGIVLRDLLIRENDEKKTIKQTFNCNVKIYIGQNIFYHRGGNLTVDSIERFNLYLEEDIKTRYRLMMDFFVETTSSFENNLPKVREMIGISLEDWDSESIKKDYYRYRKRAGKPLLYNKADR